MRYCEKCGLYIAGGRERCPLCQGALGGAHDPFETYPKIPSVYRQYHIVVRIAAFLSIVTVIVCAAVNYLFQNGFWSLFVAVAVGCLWASLSSAIRKRHNLPKCILWQVVILSGIALLWDAISPFSPGWSTNYFIPGLCAFVLPLIFVLSKCMHIRLEEYLIYLVLDALFGLIPMFFLLTGIASIAWPSVTCTALGTIVFAGLFIFADAPLKAEIKKRLHF